MNHKTHKLILILSMLASLAGVDVAVAELKNLRIQIDCYHTAFSNRESLNEIRMEAYRDGELLGFHYNYIGSKGSGTDPGCGWGASDPYFGIYLNQNADEVRFYAMGNDAAIIDELWNDKSGPDASWGVDGNNAWCLSTDPSDYSDKSNKLALGQCHSCIRFMMGAEGSPRSGGTWSTCPATRSYKLFNTHSGLNASTAASSRVFLAGDLMEAATDIAPVDHDGDGVDEIAALIDLGGDQFLFIYEADLSGDPVGRWLFGMRNVIAIAGVDHDGDGIDEIALLQANDADLNLYMYDAPIGVMPRGPAVGINKWDLADDSIDIAGVDHDGDGVDEIAALEYIYDSDLNLYIYEAPVGTQNTAKVGTNKWDLPDGGAYSLAAIDFDGDGIDEIGVLKVHRSENLIDTTVFNLYNAPIGTEDTGWIATDINRIPLAGTFEIAGVDHDGDGIDEVAVIGY